MRPLLKFVVLVLTYVLISSLSLCVAEIPACAVGCSVFRIVASMQCECGLREEEVVYLAAIKGQSTSLLPILSLLLSFLLIGLTKLLPCAVSKVL